MYTHICKFLDNHKRSVNRSDPPPIILSWLASPGMEPSLSIIDEHVAYLLKSKGGAGKLKQWFLSDDLNFNTITLERYAIRYLSHRNENLIDNIKPRGVDAYLTVDDGFIGLEVTTLSGFIADWIFLERLKLSIINFGIFSSNTLEIRYSHTELLKAMHGKRIINYIDNVANAIQTNDHQTLSNLGISVTYRDTQPGYLVFYPETGEGHPWFRYLTHELWSKLMDRNKVRQFKKYSRNIIIVGINHTSPSDGIFPEMFAHLELPPSWCQNEIAALRTYWSSRLCDLTNVIGICFYVYSLDRENPFYPLQIIWRSPLDMIDFNV